MPELVLIFNLLLSSAIAVVCSPFNFHRIENAGYERLEQNLTLLTAVNPGQFYQPQQNHSGWSVMGKVFSSFITTQWHSPHQKDKGWNKMRRQLGNRIALG